MQEFKIKGEYITLGQLLKSLGIVGGGGETKSFLAECLVQLNGEPETRRGRKLRPGDKVEINGGEPILMTNE